MLGDFRKGLVGWGSLEAPPPVARRQNVDNSSSGPRRAAASHSNGDEEVEELMLGDEEGLPPLVVEQGREKEAAKGSLDVGKGNYEGW